MIFKDGDGDELEVRLTVGDAVMLCCTQSGLGSCCIFTPFDARAVAAEIIACADRIDPPKKEPRKCKACGFTGNQSHYMTCLECDAILNDVPAPRGVDALVNPTTPTHTSHESLVSLAKAIAYLPASLRDELNALLAVKLREALK